MTEDQIERRVELMTDAVDARYMAGRLTETDYQRELREIDRWAERQLAVATNPA